MRRGTHGRISLKRLLLNTWVTRYRATEHWYPPGHSSVTRMTTSTKIQLATMQDVDDFAKAIIEAVESVQIDKMSGDTLDMFASMYGIERGGSRKQVAARLHLTPPTFGTIGHMNAVVDSEPALWTWRTVGRAHIKIVQSWENRPTRVQWRELKRWIRDEIMPAGVLVEFRGCPSCRS